MIYLVVLDFVIKLSTFNNKILHVNSLFDMSINLSYSRIKFDIFVCDLKLQLLHVFIYLVL